MSRVLVLLRHGESTANADDVFGGWLDFALTNRGRDRAAAAGRLIRDAGVEAGAVHTSLLTRAMDTADIVVAEAHSPSLPIRRSWRLNERHYGTLQGLNKAETAAKYGEAQVLTWRRSYADPPPPMAAEDERHPSHDRRYGDLSPDELPRGESLKDTVARFLPYWQGTIAPLVKAGRRVLIAAHGNSLRALVKYLDNVSDQEIVGLNIPTGVPLVYELDDDLKPLRNYYLGDPEAARRAAEAVARQGQRT